MLTLRSFRTSALMDDDSSGDEGLVMKKTAPRVSFADSATELRGRQDGAK